VPNLKADVVEAPINRVRQLGVEVIEADQRKLEDPLRIRFIASEHSLSVKCLLVERGKEDHPVHYEDSER
jgi:hypothetical protein